MGTGLQVLSGVWTTRRAQEALVKMPRCLERLCQAAVCVQHRPVYPAVPGHLSPVGEPDSRRVYRLACDAVCRGGTGWEPKEPGLSSPGLWGERALSE